MASTINASTSSGLVSTADTSGVLQLQTAGTTAVTVDASQNVGIGTSSPATKLDIRSGGATTVRIGSDTNNTGTVEFFNTTGSTVNAKIESVLAGGNSGGDLRFSTKFVSGSLTENMRLDSSGNLGLGVTPSAWVDDKALQLPQGSVSSGYEYGISVAAGAYRSASNIWRYTQSIQPVSRFNQVNGTYQWFVAPSGTAGNAITFTQAMTLDTSGNLGIGTSSPNASAILDAQSTTKGVRMPNMTTTQKNAIASPAAGLMVFDTTLAKLCVYSGSAWQTITSV
jgi:hypothetical protein